jgi:hypothetical protein
MENNLLWACLANVVLAFLVGFQMLLSRVRELRERQIDPQLTATSLQMAAQLQNVQAADNFRNQFEVPILFYSLVVIAIGLEHSPNWLNIGVWIFVISRYLHSYTIPH